MPKPQRSKVAEPAASEKRAGPMRIAKAMARAGLCSRREAERWIADGRVSVNGKLLRTPAVEVKPTDKVIVDGKPLPSAEPPQLWRYHKPKGIVTTHSDPEGRPTVFDKLPPEMPRVISIGRLDFNTEGLLLLNQRRRARTASGTAVQRLGAALSRQGQRPCLARGSGESQGRYRRSTASTTGRSRPPSTACKARIPG